MARRRPAATTIIAAGTRTARLMPPHRERHAAAAPEHLRTVKAPETPLDQIVGLFSRDHVFGPDLKALLAAQLPATDAATGRRPRRPGRRYLNPAPGELRAEGLKGVAAGARRPGAGPRTSGAPGKS
ncbi:MAG: hypothetical protein ACXVYB_19105 [Arthrobacter sp.]|jgi:hypothetical protein